MGDIPAIASLLLSRLLNLPASRHGADKRGSSFCCAAFSGRAVPVA